MFIPLKRNGTFMYKMINEGHKINVFYLFFLSLKLQEDLSTFDKKILDFNEA